MRIWNQAGYNSEHGERFNLQVRGVLPTELLVQSYQAIVLLIDIQILDDAFLKEICETPCLTFDLHKHMLCQVAVALFEVLDLKRLELRLQISITSTCRMLRV